MVFGKNFRRGFKTAAKLGHKKFKVGRKRSLFAVLPMKVDTGWRHELVRGGNLMLRDARALGEQRKARRPRKQGGGRLRILFQVDGKYDR